MESIKIDKEFEKYLSPLTDEERVALEQLILKEGCRNALVVWDNDNILIDGYHRYKICADHKREYKIIKLHFESRDEVKAWMIANQCGERNLSDFQKFELAIKLKAINQTIYDERAKKNMATSVKGKRGGQSALSETKKPINTLKELAKSVGLRQTKLYYYSKIWESDKATKEDKEALRNGAAVTPIYDKICAVENAGKKLTQLEQKISTEVKKSKPEAVKIRRESIPGEMKFKVDRAAMLSGLSVIQNIVGSKTMPILSNFLIEAQKDSLRLTATDLNLAISCVIPAQVIAQGTFTIPEDIFSRILGKLNDSMIEISTTDKSVCIKGNKYKFDIFGASADGYPTQYEYKDEKVVTVTQTALKQMLQLTAFAASTDDTKYMLLGVLFELNQNSLTFMATDGKRIAIATHKIRHEIDAKFVLPTRSVNELLRNLQDDGEVTISVSSNVVQFEFNNITILSSIRTGDTPNYKSVVPLPSDNKIKVNRNELLQALNRAKIFNTAGYLLVVLEIFSDVLVISTSTPTGIAREEVAVKYNGNEMQIGFNTDCLIDALKAFSIETIEIEVPSYDKPCVMRCDGYLHFILPMKVK